MKIRIRGNSVRLRLTQSEVNSFNNTGKIIDSIQFSVDPANNLYYALEKADIDQLSTSYTHNQIKVLVPMNMAKHWAESQEVGMEASVQLSSDKILKILVEKDFQCLTARPGEDDDTFPNPNA